MTIQAGIWREIRQLLIAAPFQSSASWLTRSLGSCTPSGQLAPVSLPCRYSEGMDWKKLLSNMRTRELTGGKRSQNPEAQWRSEFERDYDRAVFSTPVRRLQDKAQVYPLEQNDGVRTRLTHSHEVSNVARSLTKSSLMEISQTAGLSPEDIDNFATIAATCGLLHDAGNPPFGHAGERAILDWFI